MIVPPTLTLIMLGPSAAVRDAAIGAVLPINRHDSEYCEERDQFLERYYRLVTQFELMGGSFDRARAGITDAIGYLRGRPAACRSIITSATRQPASPWAWLRLTSPIAVLRQTRRTRNFSWPSLRVAKLFL